MNVQKRARVALAVAMSSLLVVPGYSLAAENPAQPGTVRPEDKTVAQPGTVKQEQPGTVKQEIVKKTQEPTPPPSAPVSAPPAKPSAVAVTPQPVATPAPVVTQQATVKPVQSVQPVTTAPVAPRTERTSVAPFAPVTTTTQVDTTPTIRQSVPPAEEAPTEVVKEPTPVAQSPVVKAESGMDEKTLAEKATEQSAGKLVREHTTERAGENEVKSVRIEHADEVAQVELAAAVEEGGDVRDKVANTGKEVVIREGDEEELTPVVDTDNDPDEIGDDGAEPVAGDVVSHGDGAVSEVAPAFAPEVTTGAAVSIGQAKASVELSMENTGTTVSFTSQHGTGLDAGVSVSVENSTNTLSVEAGGNELHAPAPVIPEPVITAVEQALPAETVAAVEQFASEVDHAVKAHIASLPTGQQVTDAGFGQVTTWLDTNSAPQG